MQKTTILLLLLVISSGLGCSKVRKYDLSTTPPFSNYVGKEVYLTRDVSIVALGASYNPVTPAEANYFEVIDPSLPDMTNSSPKQQEQAEQRVYTLRLTAGTRVRVERTQLINSRNMYTEFEDLMSRILVKDIGQDGWPDELHASFNHAAIERNDWSSLGFHRFGLPRGNRSILLRAATFRNQRACKPPTFQPERPKVTFH